MLRPESLEHIGGKANTAPFSVLGGASGAVFALPPRLLKDSGVNLAEAQDVF